MTEINQKNTPPQREESKGGEQQSLHYFCAFSSRIGKKELYASARELRKALRRLEKNEPCLSLAKILATENSPEVFSKNSVRTQDIRKQEITRQTTLSMESNGKFYIWDSATDEKGEWPLSGPKMRLCLWASRMADLIRGGVTIESIKEEVEEMLAKRAKPK